MSECGAKVACCVCVKPEGHVGAGDEIHACDPEACGGSWRGEWPDFTPVTFPLIGLGGPK